MCDKCSTCNGDPRISDLAIRLGHRPDVAFLKLANMRDDYATLAAAARRLVEAVQRREMSYETAAFVEDYYEVLAASKEQVEAATEWNAALAEVEALLKEKTK